MADYRTNIQFYHRTPSNNVQDQTASGLLRFNLASGLNIDLQGEHKLGHDPRGTAVDLLNVEVNKWTANSFTGRAAVDLEVYSATDRLVLHANELNNALEARIAALLDEKDVMLGAIGHDLKTPLTALRVRIESVEDDAERVARKAARLGVLSGLAADGVHDGGEIEDHARAEDRQ